MRVATLLAVMALCGCAGLPPAQISEPFDAAQAAAMVAPGPNTITGSALVRQAGGGIVTCAGEQVTLTPATAYANRRVQIVYGAGTIARPYIPVPAFSPDLPEYYKFRRTTTCNAQGFFKFENVADGDFILQTPVAWLVNGYTQGGMLLGRVSTRGGQVSEVTITP